MFCLCCLFWLCLHIFVKGQKAINPNIFIKNIVNLSCCWDGRMLDAEGWIMRAMLCMSYSAKIWKKHNTISLLVLLSWQSPLVWFVCKYIVMRVMLCKSLAAVWNMKTAWCEFFLSFILLKIMMKCRKQWGWCCTSF